MKALTSWARAFALLGVLLVIAACIPGNNGGGWGVGGQQGDTSTEALHARGGILIGMYSDIAPAMEALVPVWRVAHPNIPLAFSIAPTLISTANLNTYITQDVFISDSPSVLADALSQGLIRGKGTTFAGATLEFAMPSANPGAIATLQDIARPGLNLVTVRWPSGLAHYTQATLERMMRLPAFAPSNIPCNANYADCVYANSVVNVSDGIAAGTALVDSTLLSTPVPSRQLPLAGAFIYHPDVLSVERQLGAGSLRTIPVPVAYAPPIAIWAAVTSFQAVNPTSAQLFVQFLLSPAAQAILARQGYVPPSSAQTNATSPD
jgi:molybdate transport system substrate-binding protein